jgi:hypothetical protein
MVFSLPKVDRLTPREDEIKGTETSARDSTVTEQGHRAWMDANMVLVAKLEQSVPLYCTSAR